MVKLTSFKLDRAGLGSFQAGQRVHQRRLTGSRSAADEDLFSTLDLERDPAQHFDTTPPHAKGLVQIARDQLRLHRGLSHAKIDMLQDRHLRTHKSRQRRKPWRLLVNKAFVTRSLTIPSSARRSQRFRKDRGQPDIVRALRASVDPSIRPLRPGNNPVLATWPGRWLPLARDRDRCRRRSVRHKRTSRPDHNPTPGTNNCRSSNTSRRRSKRPADNERSTKIGRAKSDCSFGIRYTWCPSSFGCPECVRPAETLSPDIYC